jgi:NAD-dependent SIR2 family protein deacetylase
MDYSRRINHAVNLIKEAKRITAFTGAGVSTESGISDFRSPGKFNGSPIYQSHLSLLEVITSGAFCIFF